jgi:hypothetical protein
LWRAIRFVVFKSFPPYTQKGWRIHLQEEDFDEDEGIYDELKLDEEEEKFGLVADDDDSDDSDEASEGSFPSAVTAGLNKYKYRCSISAYEEA